MGNAFNNNNNNVNDGQDGSHGPNGNTPYSPNPNSSHGDMARLKQAQSKLNLANIAAAVSFIIGGIFLSCLSMGFAIYGRKKLKECGDVLPQLKHIQEKLLSNSKITLVLCSAAIVINVVTAIYMYPIVMDAYQSGNLLSLFGGASTSLNSSSGASSVWG